MKRNSPGGLPRLGASAANPSECRPRTPPYPPGPPAFRPADAAGRTAPPLRQAVAAAPDAALSPFLANYVAAMTETACNMRGLPVPAWTRRTEALPEPVFGSALPSLRLYLLTRSPAPFRRRNLFIDSSIGERV